MGKNLYSGSLMSAERRFTSLRDARAKGFMHGLHRILYYLQYLACIHSLAGTLALPCTLFRQLRYSYVHMHGPLYFVAIALFFSKRCRVKKTCLALRRILSYS
jgi:hypothetical protein